jgi:hypothetical protein
MKLPPFEYACPSTIDEVVALLAAHNGEAKVIAGGQSLVPMLAFRLAQPSMLVDLRKLPGLREIKIGADGVRLGALVRWRDILDDKRLDTAHPLLKTAVSHVAHYQIRNRGTVGGSLAHADPASEMPCIAVTCDAEIAVTGKAGSRTIKAADFLRGALSTALEPDEVITHASASRSSPADAAISHWPALRSLTIQMQRARLATPILACSVLATMPGGFLRPRPPSTARLSTMRWPSRSAPPQPAKSIRRRTSTPARPTAARSPAPWPSARSKPQQSERNRCDLNALPSSFVPANAGTQSQ